ncbi:hypothetical protein GMB86_04870 [Terrilactibacillus sp. BCM23-1]|uniref:Cupin n=1 Tax=Terrilactibacillus tamarindi TaxID=2599694 RepID=A0A6N8CP41_9BACI|nr:hypothetical protein [Terrilactibacillus tamarindi]MTT31350.1 hypothetical protein [Terrilactibacillus tamarindi]
MELLTCQFQQQMKERLFHDPSQTIVHLSLAKNQEVPEHHGGNALVTVIPVKGEIVFSTQEQSETLVPGKLVRLNAREPHSLKALQESEVIVVKIPVSKEI